MEWADTEIAALAKSVTAYADGRLPSPVNDSAEAAVSGPPSDVQTALANVLAAAFILSFPCAIGRAPVSTGSSAQLRDRPGHPWFLKQRYRRKCRMHWIDIVEFSFYLVETFALPFAILVFLIERRKERHVEEEEIYQRLSDEYTNFLKLVLDNADLHLLRKDALLNQLSEEQMERKFALFGILVSIFERAYILVYEEHMSKQTRRLWSSWGDYMREWCRRPDFRRALPELLEGEDPDFRKHIQGIAQAVSSAVNA
jgi:hypothetical protein